MKYILPAPKSAPSPDLHLDVLLDPDTEFCFDKEMGVLLLDKQHSRCPDEAGNGKDEKVLIKGQTERKGNPADNRTGDGTQPSDSEGPADSAGTHFRRVILGCVGIGDDLSADRRRPGNGHQDIE